jgi:coenzyme F420-reducing hydrogenase delta subunit
VAGVVVAACPPRDCQGREGPRWLEERLYAGREAELRESLDRRRLRVVYAGAAERRVLLREIDAFRRSLDSLPGQSVELDAELDTECSPAAEGNP